MRFRRRHHDGRALRELLNDGVWKSVNESAEVQALVPGFDSVADLTPFLQLNTDGRKALAELAGDLPDAAAGEARMLPPVDVRSFRDFMLYEEHVINASRGLVRRVMPGVYPIARAYETVLRRPFPRFKPHKLWYQQPIYYFGNGLNVLTDGDPMPWPKYTDLLDYELEIGAVLVRPLRNASAEEAAAAIGGFVLINDFSARDVQIDEMFSGFGPQKAKHFGSAISAEVVTADEILPILDELTGSVSINGQQVATVSSAGAQFTLPEAIAFASTCEDLHPGELFGSGTLPGGAGIENDALVKSGDNLTLVVDGLASLTNVVSAKEQ
ncbi:MAG: fumarylacetoacetate hydrolase family protein [Pseudomonadota bacterium]